jgi:hypothetical protein
VGKSYIPSLDAIRDVLAGIALFLLFLLFIYSPYRHYQEVLEAKQRADKQLADAMTPNIIVKEPKFKPPTILYIDYYNESNTGATDSTSKVVASVEQDGKKVVLSTPPRPDQLPTKIPPHHLQQMYMELDQRIYDAVIAGTMRLYVDVTNNYKAMGRDGMTIYKFEYDHKPKRFMILMSR